jgi:hypothetical protein
LKTNAQRRRDALYSGIADMPPPSLENAVERFDHGYPRKPHAAVTYLLYDLHRLRTRTARRSLPGLATAI